MAPDSSTSSPADDTPAAAVPASKPKRRVGMWFARVVCCVVALSGLLLAAAPQGRAIVRSGKMLVSVLGAANDTSTQNRTDIRHTSFTVAGGAGTGYVDLFEPQSGAPPIPGGREAMLIISGVGDNRPVPQFVNFVDSFAESGLVVMTLTTDALLDYRLAPGDRDAVVAAFQQLQHHAGVNPHAVGMVALSAGSGPISLAAADPRIRDQVAFIALFGGYFSAADLVRDLGQRALTFDSHTEAWQPQDVPVAVLANSVTPLLPYADRTAFNDAFSNGIVLLDDATLAAFAPVSRAIYHLLAGDEPTQVDANLAQLTPEILQLLTDLSPQSVYTDIHAKIFLLHDRHDLYIPFTESRHYAAALQAAGKNYEYVEFNIFQHVEVKGDLPIGQLLGDGTHLFGLLYQIVLYGA